MKFDITHEGRTTLSVEHAQALELGYPSAVIGAAIKDAAHGVISRFADEHRAKLASASAGKLAEYRIKEGIAADPASAAADELALIDREAVARGIDRDALLSIISTKAVAYRHIALLIGALEAEAGAQITAIANDDPDIEAQVQTVLLTAQGAADTAFEAAVVLVSGG